MNLYTLTFFGRMRWTNDLLEWHTIEVYADTLYQAKMSVLVDYRDVSQLSEARKAA